MSPYTETFNCLGTDTGNNTDAITDGMFDPQGDGVTCNGRIVTNASGCQLTEEKFFSYVSSADYAAQTPGSIESTIVDDSRFGVVPVVAPTDLESGKKSWLIVDFVGAYITRVNDESGAELLTPSGKVHTVQVMLFELDMIDSEGLTNDQESYEYLGKGPKIPVLIK